MTSPYRSDRDKPNEVLNRRVAMEMSSQTPSPICIVPSSPVYYINLIQHLPFGQIVDIGASLAFQNLSSKEVHEICRPRRSM